jgi:hypothetical protein
MTKVMDRPWSRHAVASGSGRPRAGETEADVGFARSDQALEGDIDVAYHAKYDRYGARIVGHVVGPEAHSVPARPALGRRR